MTSPNDSFTAYLKTHALTFVVVVTAAIITAYAAMTAEVVSYLDGSNSSGWRDFFLVVFWSTPVFFFFQLVALVLLLWQVVYRKGNVIPGARPVSRWFLLLGVAVAPIIMLTVSSMFVGAYQEQYGHWFFYTNDALAGLILLPYYVVGSAIVARGLLRPDYPSKSGMHLLVLLTLLAVCAWYVFATAVLDMATDGLINMRFTAVVPGVAAANYALLSIDSKRRGLHRPVRKPVLITWFSALAVTVMLKIPLAMRLFAALPVERPNGYGDCFVVGAAAQGHPGFVGSRLDSSTGRITNQQLHTLRAFETRLAHSYPIAHRRLRRLYNRIGPRIANRINSPLIADAIYLSLKPVEWLASLYLYVKTDRRR